MRREKLGLLAGLFGIGILGTVGVVACSDDAPAAAAPATSDAGPASTAAPDAGASPDAAPGPAPRVQLVNNIASFTPSETARLCLSSGSTMLTEKSILAERASAAPLALSAEVGARLVTDAITIYLVPVSITKPCAEAIALTNTDVVKLPELPRGTFHGNKPYVLMLLGCLAPGLFETRCSRKADGTISGTESTLRATVTELDTSAVDASSIGFQFINGAFGLNLADDVLPVQAMATGGWNDGPKPVGTPVGFGETPTITPATAAQIPSVGFLPPSNGGFALRETNADGAKLAEVTTASLTEVTFAAGKRYVLVNVGQFPSYKILAFPLPQ